jgi:hypothetical protein
MANRTATLYSRITTSDGGKSYCKPVYQSKGRHKPQYATVNGEPKHHKEGVYYLRFSTDGGKQQFVLVGKDPYSALDKLGEMKSSGGSGTGNGGSFLKRPSILQRKAVGSASTMRSSSISRTFTHRGKMADAMGLGVSRVRVDK